MISLLFALTLAAAEPEITAAPAAPPKAETAAERRRRERAYEQQRIVCRVLTPTGSSLPQEVCQSQADWDRIRRQSLEDARIISDVSRDMRR